MSARMEVFVRMESMTTLVSVLWDMLAGWSFIIEFLPYCLFDQSKILLINMFNLFYYFFFYLY